MSLWQALLEEYSQSSLDTSRVVVVGDAQDGKRSLIGRFKGKDMKDVPEYFGLGYGYVDVIGKVPKSEEDQKSRVEFYSVSGQEHAQLLSLALPTPQSLNGATAIVILDLSRPWAVMERLRTWLDILAAHISQLTSSSAEGEAIKAQNKAKLESYLNDFNRSGMQVVMPGSPKLKASMKTLAEMEPSKLEKFIGIPLMIIGTKVDLLDRVLSQDATRTPQQAQHACNFVQGNIRKVAISYGASVTFTSCIPQRPTNCKLLLEYIGHRVCGFSLPESSKNLVASSLDCFVPAGADSVELINMLTVQNAMPTSYHDVTSPTSVPATEITLDVPFDKVIIPEVNTNIEPPLEIPPVDHIAWLKQKKDTLTADTTGTRIGSAMSPPRVRLDPTLGRQQSGVGFGGHEKTSEPIERKAEMFFATMTKQHQAQRDSTLKTVKK
eukprot:PhF_6_TR26340/c0_g1_i1/m.37893/K10416/DYNC1LI, DNCLI; dynein light intermediate chain 1, cytosolic